MAICNNSKHFFEANKLSADFFIFHSKREAIAHGRMATDPVFPLWAPNCHLHEWQFGSFFAEIPRSPTIKVPIYRRFRGVGREKAPRCCFRSPHRPTLPRQLPSLFERNMSQLFTCDDSGLMPTATMSAYPRSNSGKHLHGVAVHAGWHCVIRPCSQYLREQSGASDDGCAWLRRGRGALARHRCVRDDSHALFDANHHIPAD